MRADNSGAYDYKNEQDYEYQSNVIKLQKSYVCLQGNYYDDVSNLPSNMYNFILSFFTEDDENDCGGKKFDNVKYSS